MAPVRSWLIGLVAVGLVAAGVWLAGGFAPLKNYPGRQLQPGEQIELTHWMVSVDSCAFVPPGQSPDEFGHAELLFTVTNTWDRTLSGPNHKTVQIELPHGEIHGGSGGYIVFRDPEHSGDFDPGFTRPAIVALSLEDDTWTGGGQVLVRLATEEQVRSFLSGTRWDAADEVARVLLDCPEVGS